MKRHRDSQKRFYVRGACYFITTKTHHNFPYFKEKVFCELFVEHLRLCKSIKKFELFGWFLGYDHAHLLLRPGDEFNYSNIMKSLKENVSYTINRITDFKGATLTSRLQKMHHHFDILSYAKQFRQKHGNGFRIPPFQWQKSFHDHYIRDWHDFMGHMNYIQGNPAKHGLPDDWPYVFTNPQYDDLIDPF